MWINLQRDILEDFVAVDKWTILALFEGLSIKRVKSGANHSWPELLRRAQKREIHQELKNRLAVLTQRKSSWIIEELRAELEAPACKSVDCRIGSAMVELGWKRKRKWRKDVTFTVYERSSNVIQVWT